MRTFYIYLACAASFLFVTPMHASQYLPIPTQVSPSNGTVGVYGYAVLTWNYVPDYYYTYGSPQQQALNVFNRYHVQVATDSSFGNIIYDDANLTDTTTFVPSLDYYTMYYWHVRVADPSDTSGWSNTWNFRTIVGPADLASPLDNAVGMSITPTLHWYVEPGATSYNLYIADDVESEYTIYSEFGIVDTFATVPPGYLDNSTTYYWWVEAVEPAGTGYWSYDWAFTTIAAPPELATPIDGATALPLNPELVWYSSSYAIVYEIEVDDDPAFGSVEYQASLTDTSIQIPASILSEFTEYYWRVRLQEPAGFSEWSEVWKFRTIVAPPVQLSPANNETGVLIDALAEWYPSPGANAYEIQVFHDPGMLDTLVNDYVSNTTLYPLNGHLVYFSNYFWKVRAVEPGGNSAWSPLWRFRTIVPPPSLVLPTNTETAVATLPDFEWAASPNATGYRIQISKSQVFNTTEVDESGIPGTQYTPGNAFDEYTVYFWHVAAIDPGGKDSWSVVWQFRTIVPPPNPITPLANATALTIPLKMTWSAVQDADAYRLQCSSAPDFSAPFVDNTSIAMPSFYLYGISGYETVYWRLASVENGRFSRWSSARSFRTLIDAPLLSGPVNNAKTVPLNPEFEWYELPGANSYQFQLAQNESFETTLEDRSGIRDENVQVQGLHNNTQYCWRVRGFDDGIPGPWSEVFTFRTLLSGPSLVFPDSGAIDLPVAQSFVWNAVEGAKAYRMQVSTDSMFANIRFDRYEAADTTVAINPLDYSSMYYWRAQFVDGDGASDWSTYWAFATTFAPPTAPTLLYPLDNTTGEPVSTILEWSQGSTVTYRVQMATDAAFSNIVVDDSGLSSAIYSVGPLDYGTDYYWRVAAKDQQGLFEWSAVWKFSTIVAPPDLTFPHDGDRLSPLPLTLQWAAVAGGDTYYIQIAGDSAFKNIAVNQSGLSATSYMFSGIKPYTQYFWRVRSTGKGSNSAWSDIWEFETTTPGPTLVAPANTAANIPVQTLFEWQEVDGTYYYEIEVSEDDAFTAIVLTSDTVTSPQFQAAALDFGTAYHWRVRSWNGQVYSGWSAIWSFTTERPPIAAPVLQSPGNGAVGLDPSVLFRWEQATGAATYRIQIAGDAAFSAMVIDESGISTTSYQSSGLQKGVRYFWRVKSEASFGNSDWSAVWNFTTGGLVPLLVAPNNGAQFVSIPPTLQWRVLQGALNYTVQVSLSQSFAIQQFEETVGATATSVSATGLEVGKQYYWRVRGTDAAGPTGWSDIWTFYTIPTGPALSTPSNGAQQVATDVFLVWLPATGAQTYTAHISTDPGFTSDVDEQTGITGTSWQPANLGVDVTYYWRVKAAYGGGESAWSSTWSFSTGKPAPVLAAPGNGSSGHPPAVDLLWQSYAGGSGYHIQVARDDSFTDMFQDQDNVSGQVYPLSELEGLTTYYWRVLAHTSTGDTPWSETWSFTTASQIPELVSPFDGATDQAVPVTLEWLPVVGAASYAVEVATDAGFTSIALSAGNESGLQYIANGLEPSRSYYWRIRANFALVSGPWSDSRMFTTEGGLPVLLTPEDLAANVPLTPQFTWTAVSGAPSYDFQLATDAVFSVPLVNETGLTAAEYSGTTLDPSKTYYWRVRITGGLWTLPYSFTTLPDVPAAPVLIAPPDGNTVAGMPVVLQWQAVASADEYNVEVSTSADMSATVVSESSITATDYSLTQLTPGTTYFWRIGAVNAAGTGPWSNIWSFIVPVSGVLTVQYGAGTLSSPLTVTGTLPQGFVPGSATLFYKPVGAAAFDSTVMSINGDQVSGTVPPAAVTIRGVAAWVRAVSSNGQTVLTDPAVDPESAPQYIRVAFAQVENPVPFILQRYAMVSVPAVLNNPSPVTQLTDDYGAYDTRFWRALRWNGTAYDEFPGISDLHNSRGWWLITQFGRGFHVEQGQSVDPESEGTITLAPGWNQIGSPYAFNVAWQDIPGTGSLTGPFGFDGLEYLPDRPVLEAWKGYFVFNETASTIVLDVPPRESFVPPGKVQLAADASYMLRISLEDPSGNWRDTYNDVGLSRGEPDRVPEPPSVTAAPELHVNDGGGTYMRILKRPGMEGNTWELSLTSPNPARPALGRFTTFGALPAGWSAILFDARTGAVYAPSSREFELRTTHSGQFIVAAGTEAYLEAFLQDRSLVPLHTGLEDNYPNPFNPSTVIPFTVHSQSDLSIRIYDVHGRSIKSLADGNYSAGRYTVMWDGTDETGAYAPTGTYLCKMSAKGRTWVQILTLTK